MGDEAFLKEVGARIHAQRKKCGLTQEQLAEQMDVSIQMISNLELGKKAIRPQNLAKICGILKVSADYILRGERADWELSSLAEAIARLSVEDQQLVEQLVTRLGEG